MDANQVHNIPEENWFLRIDGIGGGEWFDTDESDYEKARVSALGIYKRHRREYGAVLMHRTNRRCVIFDKDPRQLASFTKMA